MGYSVCVTTWEAISTARSWVTSTIKYPASDSLTSANGPSVGTGTSLRNRTVLAWLGLTRPPPVTSSPAARNFAVRLYQLLVPARDPVRRPVLYRGTQPAEHHDHVLHPSSLPRAPGSGRPHLAGAVTRFWAAGRNFGGTAAGSGPGPARWMAGRLR